MSCDYKIRGAATLRRSPEVLEAIENLRTDILGEEYVELDTIDENTLELRVDYDDMNAVNTPEHVSSVLGSIALAVIGSAAFEITTGGESWTEWIGDASVIRKDKSLAALRMIEENAAELISDDLARAIDLLQQRQRDIR